MITKKFDGFRSLLRGTFFEQGFSRASFSSNIPPRFNSAFLICCGNEPGVVCDFCNMDVDNTAHPPAERGGFIGLASKIIRQLILLYIFKQLVSYMTGSTSSVNPLSSAGSRPTLTFGQHYDLIVYLYDKPLLPEPNNLNPFWVLQGLEYGNWSEGENHDSVFQIEQTIPTPKCLFRNESLYLHVIISKDPDSDSGHHTWNNRVHYVKQLNKYKKKHYKKTSNLLTGESEQSLIEQSKADSLPFEVLNHWHPNITLNMAYDQQVLSTGGSVPQVEVKFSEDGHFYHPFFMFNTFWNLNTDYKLLDDSVEELDLRITFYPLSMMKFMLYSSWETKNQNKMSFLEMEDDHEGDDSLKIALIETNPILLAVTFVVSILHMVFEFLAFKNDIQFWNTRSDLVGLSVKTVLFNIFQSVVVFLYVCDNDTNFMIKCSTGVALLIECWKIPKVLDVHVNWNEKLFGILPRLSFTDKGTYVESDTKIYDEMAFKYLSWALFPLLFGYGIYSLLYNEHKGWYSFVLNLLYGFLLTFGFIAMTPQLFINYKLRSVAHLPWRMMTYKFINTFIDDLFAFVTRMPWLYRVSCFRDDIIFIIYLYQRWVYRVDPKRINEFGVAMEQPANGNEMPVEDVPTNSLESKKDK